MTWKRLLKISFTFNPLSTEPKNAILAIYSYFDCEIIIQCLMFECFGTFAQEYLYLDNQHPEIVYLLLCDSNMSLK